MTHRFLPTPLRKALEKDIKKAREIAEDGATAAIARLGVADATAPAHLSEDDKAARRRLRAHARALGDAKAADGEHTVDRLVEAAAYAQWHRRLFARFLAERDLLRHPIHGVAVTLEDAEELAGEEGYADGWSAAEAYAAKMLPAVFQPDDPVLALTLAPEHEQALRNLVLGLDPETFQTDDALGWTYQFWRALEKDRVNKAGHKIGARDLPAVTQLFTEPYMVQFLLHNTLGAWRAGKVLVARPELAADAADELTLRAAVSPPDYSFDMLRFVRESEDAPWRPAAGTYPGWPETAAAIRALDPCCGSGHFLTEILSILAALRADEEGITEVEAVAAVLRDNLFGLELDERCVQIAAFAVALTAWRIGGFQPFGSEQVHIAWVGSAAPLPRVEFLELANGDDELRQGLAGLHDAFVQAPLLGSLIELKGGDLISPQRLGRIEPLLDSLVEKTRAAEPERAEGAVAARGMADAAAILSRNYTLVATNVPFLGRGKQHASLAAHIERADKDAKADLATAMLSRALRLLDRGGTAAAVTPQNWLFLGSYKHLRARLLDRTTLNMVGALGPRAFETISGEVVNTALVAISAILPDASAVFAGLDANDGRDADGKRAELFEDVRLISQGAQTRNPDSRISLSEEVGGSLLSRYAVALNGLHGADSAHFRQLFWEHSELSPRWRYLQLTVDANDAFSGREHVFWWADEGREHLRNPNARVQGMQGWSRDGVAVSMMQDLAVTRYTGEAFDISVSPIIPNDPAHLTAIWAFCSSAQYAKAVRLIDQAVKVTNGTLVKVPFDLSHWSTVATEKYPNELPEPYSDDPTQWLFHGHPAQAEVGTHLHVALARLAGYRWPSESDPDMRLSASVHYRDTDIR
jgi:hypothetical protein